MRHGDYDDPLLRQVLPAAAELNNPDGFDSDPLAEAAAYRAPGLLQKYQRRVLLMATASCGVHCRYCFRREYPYADSVSDMHRWQRALSSIAADTEIEEVILSGGDPLLLGNDRLGDLLRRLSAISHINRLRIHTRQPIVLPARIDDPLCGLLRNQRWRVVMVLHANHANEIDAEVQSACARLRDAGVTLLSQSVLLAGVNDNAEALCALSRSLDSAGVLPYYLHQLDRVRGASHFAVDDARALALHRQMLAGLPGYLVPRLVREVPGADSKLPLPIPA
jgi:EF-P beta-lysylation protein EpmB